jgi:2-polyprenyl-6-hydroxyphenyl methylase/3-demethylubiquinone-9 3-methyltransferase
MGFGPTVRHRLGRLETPAANLYRSLFIDLDVLASRIEAKASADRILEVGCGDGSLGTRLLGVYPDAEYVGIDVAPTAGRLFQGDNDRATFRTVSVQDFAAERHDPFDLVVLVDVVHHIPPPLRAQVLHCSADLVRPYGYLMVKEFERNRRPYYYLTYAADRYITGDKEVSFMTLPEVRSMIGAIEGFGPIAQLRTPPAHNNVLLARRRLP